MKFPVSSSSCFHPSSKDAGLSASIFCKLGNVLSDTGAAFILGSEVIGLLSKSDRTCPRRAEQIVLENVGVF